MKKMFIAVLCALGIATAQAEQLDHWELGNGTMTDGEWTFNISRRGTDAVGVENTKELWIISCAEAPSTITTLDFGKPISEYNNTKYEITSLNAYTQATWLTDAGKDALGRLVLPTGAQFNLGGAFNGCTNLTEVTPFLPPNCIKAGRNAFNGCTKLASPLVYSGNFDIFFNAGDCSGWNILTGTAVPSVDLSESAITMVSREFIANDAALTSVKLPATMTSFDGANQFANCTALTSVEFHSVPTGFGGGFYGCSNLSEVHFYACAPTATPPATVYNGAANGKMLTTYLHNMTDVQLESWALCAQGGEITMGSTWSQATVGNAYVNRPLVPHVDLSIYSVGVVNGEDASEALGKIGYFVFSRGEDDPDNELVLTIPYIVSGTAINGTTYRMLSGTVVIPSGVDSVNVNVFPLFDENITDDSTVTVTIGNVEYTVIEDEESATLTIENGTTYGGWVVDGSNNMTLGDWTFTVERRGTKVSTDPVIYELYVTACTAYPSSPSELDFSRCILDQSGQGRDYAITKVSPKFGNNGGVGGDAAPSVKSVKLPDLGYPLVIGDSAFSGCVNLETVEPFLPVTCTTLERAAFINCPKLETPLVFCGSDVGTDGSWSGVGIFKGCSKLPSADLSNSTIPALRREVFDSCTSLEWVKLPPTCTKIGYPDEPSSLLNRNPFGGTMSVRLILTGTDIVTKTLDLPQVTAIEFASEIGSLTDGAFASTEYSKLTELMFAGAKPANIGVDLFAGQAAGKITVYVPEKELGSWGPLATDGVITKKHGEWVSGTSQLIRSYGLKSHFTLLLY